MLFRSSTRAKGLLHELFPYILFAGLSVALMFLFGINKPYREVESSEPLILLLVGSYLVPAILALIHAKNWIIRILILIVYYLSVKSFFNMGSTVMDAYQGWFMALVFIIPFVSLILIVGSNYLNKPNAELVDTSKTVTEKKVS